MLSHIDIDPSQVHTKAAFTTVTSVVSAAIAHSGGINPMIQTIAGIVAIVSGCMAIAYYYVSILEKIRNRRH
jgi:hypothetical protein